MKKISEEAMNAAYIAALLSGKDLSTSVSETDTDETTEVDVVFEDEIPKEKKKKAPKDKKEKKPKEEDLPKEVPMLPEYTGGEILKETKFPVKFNEHNIYYKDQVWPIKERTVMYTLTRVDLPQQAVNIAARLHNEEDEWKNKARLGDNRYLVLMTADENVKNEVRQLAYVEVTDKKQVRFLIENTIAERNHVDVEMLNDYMKKASKYAVRLHK